MAKIVVKKDYFPAFKTHKISFEYSDEDIEEIEAIAKAFLGSKRASLVDDKESIISLAILYENKTKNRG